ncbi:MAG: c-type cytochrome [bacterium]
MKFRRALKSFFIGLVLIWVWVSAGVGQQLWLPKDPLKGRLVFEKKGCLDCHAINGYGGKIGPDLGEKPFYGSFLELAGVMWNHSPQMSAKMREVNLSRPTFSGREMNELIAYLYYLRYLGEPGNVAQGEKLLSEKGCLMCHSVGGRGGTSGPSLDTMKRYVSPLYLAQAMWNHGPEMERRMRRLGIKRPRFEGREMVDLAAYIRAASIEAPGQMVYLAPGDPKEGEKLFSEKGCVACHAVYGQGGRSGPDLGTAELSQGVTEIAGIMWNHGPQMWRTMEKTDVPRPRFTGKEMADVIAYLYFLKFIDEAGDPKVGQELFSGKGCITCHAIKGKGGQVGLDLAESEKVSSPIEMTEIMWNHAPLMEQMMEERHLSWPQFKGRDMANLYAYLQSLR